MSTAAKLIRTKRQEFAAPNGKHDRNVKLLRFILPVAVGILGSMLALAPFTMRGELSFVLDKNSVDVAKERMRVTEENVRVPGPVQVEAANGYRLSTSNVIVDFKERSLRSEGVVEGRTNIGTFRADRLEADLAGRTVSLNGNARLRIEQNGLRRP